MFWNFDAISYIIMGLAMLRLALIFKRNINDSSYVNA